MFIVHYSQEDTECEYNSIGCGQMVVRLPPEVTTLEEADTYVRGNRVNSLKYLGLSKIHTARIYEVKNYHHVNVDAEKRVAQIEKEQRDNGRDSAVINTLSKIPGAGSSIISPPKSPQTKGTK